jgi:hypothetical protein
VTRYWTCRKCEISHPRIEQKCHACGQARPAARRPKHKAALDAPYEDWVQLFGERCGICDRPPGPTRRLDRDHDHRTGQMRGLLCHRCNRALPNWVDVAWLKAATEYVQLADTRNAA